MHVIYTNIPPKDFGRNTGCRGGRGLLRLANCSIATSSIEGFKRREIKELCKLAADNTARRSNICEMHEPWKVTRGHMHNLSEYQV